MKKKNIFCVIYGKITNYFFVKNFLNTIRYIRIVFIFESTHYPLLHFNDIILEAGMDTSAMLMGNHIIINEYINLMLNK